MLSVNDPGPFDDGDEPNPFGDMAAGLNQIFSLFGGLGPGGGLGPTPDWSQAKQQAAAIASGGVSEPNMDPLVRIQFEQLARVAELQVEQLTGFVLSRGGHGLAVTPVTRAQWTSATIDGYRSLFERLAGSIGAMMTGQLGELSTEDIDEMSSMMPPGLGIDMSAIVAGMSSFIGPIMLVTMTSSTVGQLARRAFGFYDLPVPRAAGDEILVLATNIDEFSEQWSLPVDDLRLSVCIHEMAHHAVLSQPHIRDRLNELLAAHASGFEADPDALENQLGSVDLNDATSLEMLQGKLGNPEFMLNAIRSDAQRNVLPLIDTLVSCIEGYVDWVVDTIGVRLLAEFPMVSEALRRRRVEADEASRFIERLFGLELTQAKIDQGNEFISGVVARGGVEALAVLWSDVEHLPTPNELLAPGLWMARVGIEGVQLDLPELGTDTEIPDYPDFSG